MKYYAYLILATGEQGVTTHWKECEKKTKGIPARYRSFTSERDAKAWLAAGAQYESKPQIKLQPGVYFDAGTGRGNGVEISVTDERGIDLLHTVLAKSKINKFGKHKVTGKVTNNYGELLACKYALKYAMKHDIAQIFGDSRLVTEFWSKGFTKKDIAPKTATLAKEVAKLRSAFEKAGGTIEHISGDHNPADLGFH